MLLSPLTSYPLCMLSEKDYEKLRKGRASVKWRNFGPILRFFGIILFVL